MKLAVYTGLFAMLLCAPNARAAAEGAPAAPALAVGVAPFEVDAPPGAAVPDVASLLAERLGSSGEARIVGPGQLGAAADVEAGSEQVRAWADGAEVDAVVVGRTTRVGDQLSLDVRLRQGDTGVVADRFVQEIGRPEDLSSAVDAVAARVIARTAALREPAAAAASVAAAAPATTSEQPTKPARDRFGFRDWDPDAPLSIESEELDIQEQEGRRRLVFGGNVRASQGDFKLSAARLVATYPQGSKDPERLEASGNVRLAQRDQKARCDGAVFDRVHDLFTCRGNAAYRDGDNCMSGEEIVIDLSKDSVKVKGGATVRIRPEGEGCGL